MKYLPILALLCCTAGCGLFGSSEPDHNAAADPREAERAETRSKLNAKKSELSQTDSDLSKTAVEREALSSEAPSDKKTNRLVELSRIESDLKLKKASLSEEMSQLEQQLGGTAPAPSAKKPEKAGDALDDILAGNASKEKEKAQRRKQKTQAEP